MAWGYWSATTVPDRGRSPRRHTASTNTSQVPTAAPAIPGGSHRHHHHNNGGGSGGSGGSSGPVEEDDYAPPPSSRRPSLVDIEFSGPGGALALVLCGNTPRPGVNSLPRELVGPSAMTAATTSTTTILRHECFLQSSALVHHHQCRVHDLSGSEDEDPDPGYASGKSCPLV